MMLKTSLHKMVSEYTSAIIYLLPMLSGNVYVFADNNGDGICEYKATYVRLYYTPLKVSPQVMFLCLIH